MNKIEVTLKFADGILQSCETTTSNETATSNVSSPEVEREATKLGKSVDCHDRKGTAKHMEMLSGLSSFEIKKILDAFPNDFWNRGYFRGIPQRAGCTCKQVGCRVCHPNHR